MSEVKVIIGANYGDEGKGLATHYFSAKAKAEGKTCVNVLFNGGAQRGHTVNYADGYTHVYHHFGSGTLDGADTYFDRLFILNPTVFLEEYHELIKKNPNFKIYYADECRVSTFYDVILNRVIEESRGKDRHGSCGLGIWETHVRYMCTNCNLTARQMANLPLNRFKNYMLKIKDYFFDRLAEKGISYSDIDDKYKKVIEDDEAIENWIWCFRRMISLMTRREQFYSNNPYDVIIFEGAQGLALDENNLRALPHTTPSSTTSEIPLKRILSTEKEYDSIEVCYISRSYFTRHGAGYLRGECPVEEINPLIKDETNVTNEWQGTLRYAKMHVKDCVYRIFKDMQIAKDHSKKIKHSLFFTHLNYAYPKDLILMLRGEEKSIDNYYTSDTKYAEDVNEHYFF